MSRISLEVKTDFVKQIVQGLDINFEVTPVQSLKSVTKEMKMSRVGKLRLCLQIFQIQEQQLKRKREC